MRKKGDGVNMGREKLLGVVIEDLCGDLYIQPIDLDERYFLPKSFSEGAFVGDTVLFRVKSVSKKTEQKPTTTNGTSVTQYAIVDQIQEYSNLYYSGVCEAQGEQLTFVPDDKGMNSYNVFKTKRGGAQDLERVVAQISRKKFSQEFKAGVERIYGSSEEILPYINASADSVNLNLGWDNDEGVTESDLVTPINKRRKDFRTKATVALTDGKSPCDHAFSMERDGDDFIVYLHLLDVDGYIPLGSKLDELAKPRLRTPDGFEKKRPLFPKRVSDSIEFKEGEDRCAVTVSARYSSDLVLKALYIDESIVNLTIKASYEEVDLILKVADVSRMHSFYERVYEVKELGSMMLSFAGQVLASMDTRGGFVGTCLAPSFVFETGANSQLVEKKLFDGELLENCILSAMSIAIGETAAKEGIPILFEGEYPLAESELESFSSYCRGPLTNNNVCAALSSLYNCCERGVYERTAYNEIYSRYVETRISEKPVQNTLKGSDTVAVTDSPLSSYVGLTMLRLLKKSANNSVEGCAELIKDVVFRYNVVMPYIFKTCRAAYARIMFVHTASLPTPAEAIVSAFDEEKAIVTLADGSIGYIFADARNVVKLDDEAKTLTVGSKTYSYGDYITVLTSDADEKRGIVKYTPLR